MTAWMTAPTPGTPTIETPLQFAAALWNKEHPGQRVKLVLNQAIPFSPFLAKLTTAYAAHTAPDIAYGLPGGWPFPAARGGYLAPINRLTPGWFKSVYDKEFYPQVRGFEPVKGGNTYALPTQEGAVDGLWYRKDWFAAHHLPPPDTWSRLRNDAAFFAQPSITARYRLQGAFLLAASATTPKATGSQGLGFFWAAGGRILPDGRVTFDSPAVIRALTFLRSMRQQGLIPRSALTTTTEISTASLARGRVPMAVGESSDYINIQQDGGLSNKQMGNEFAWIPFPRMTSHSTPVDSPGGPSEAMVSKSPVEKQAAQLIELSLSPKVAAEEAAAQRAAIAKDGLKAAPAVELPVEPSELGDMVGPPGEVSFVKTVVAAAEPDARKSLAFTYGAPVQTEVGKALDSAVFGTTTPAEAARQAASAIRTETGLP